MSSNPPDYKPAVLFGFLALLAIFLGVVLANPTSREATIGTGLVVGALLLPFALKHHQLALVALLQAPIKAFFFPGQPGLWLLVSFMSFGMAILAWALASRNRPTWDMRAGWPLIFLLVVVVITAQIHGGIGSKVLGSGAWGGMRYLTVVAAIVAFFAISARPISVGDVKRFSDWYFLSGVLSAVSNLIFIAGPAFYFLFTVFSFELASFQINDSGIERYTGLALAAAAAMNWMLLRHGIRGLTSFQSVWRLPVFAVLMGVSLLGGFRSTLLMLILLLLFQFGFERLFRGRHLVGLVGAIVLTLALLVALGDRLPLSIQRSLSFLPIELSPVAKADAAGTLDWRLEMWAVVIPEVPKYLWIGKGFSFSGADFYLTNLAVSEGRLAAYEDTLISGNYHQGILTLIIPFGLGGLLAFAWFAGAGWWILFNNYRRSPDAIRHVNTFLLSYYSARLLFYLTLYGQFDLDLIVFTSCVALSGAINRGHFLAQKQGQSDEGRVPALWPREVAVAKG